MKSPSFRSAFRGSVLATCVWFVAATSPCVSPVTSSAQADGPSETKLRVEKSESGWSIYDGDRLFAGYVLDSGGKPIVYPIHGPGNHAMTRDFPMKKNVRMERGDHDHQRSMWLTHGEVNGVDFWKDDEGCGKIVHRQGQAKLDEATGNIVLVTENDWLGLDGNRVLSDTRRFEFAVDGNRRIIDCDFLLKSTDGDVNFGDTKEGSFGMRIAASMKVDAKKGGEITNDSGKHNKEAWGQESAWVDYSGPVDDETVGITIHNHPSSFGFPTRWHVRTYGLFAANPFGQRDFLGGKKRDGIVLLDGKSLRLNYRIILYQGKFDAEVAESDAKRYHNDPRPVLE